MIEPHPTEPGAFLLSCEQWLDVPRERAFEFFGDAFQLEAITPPWLRFHVLTPRPIEMRAGTLIDYRLRLHGIPVKWRTEISVWEPPIRFVDRQISGPYAVWIHEHTFEEQDGGTLVRDRVTYRIPYGRMIGGLANRILVKRDLENIFRFRQDALARLLSNAPATR